MAGQAVYQPGPLPRDAAALGPYTRAELERVAAELQAPLVTWPVTYVAPAKPRVGNTYYADGTKWNPGSGEGLYVYKSTGSWVLLG